MQLNTQCLWHFKASWNCLSESYYYSLFHQIISTVVLKFGVDFFVGAFLVTGLISPLPWNKNGLTSKIHNKDENENMIGEEIHTK